MNFRDAYEFDPETYAGEGGLLGRLRALIPQQEAYPGVAPNVAPEANPNGSGSPQGGLLGTLLALQTEQSRYQPIPESRGQPPSVAQNPNFRQLSRAPAVVRPQGTIGPSNLSDNQSNPSYSPFGEGAALDLLRTSQLQQSQYHQSSSDKAASERRAFVQRIVTAGRNLGVDPLNIATVISYETRGTFDPNVWNKGRTHMGLIQFGKDERERYGVTEGRSPAEQMVAVERYLRDRGVTPRRGGLLDKNDPMLDLYSAINTGYVSRYDLSDANNGGAPGTVADKVAGMGAHRLKAARLLVEHAPPAFPTAPGKPIRTLSRRIVGGPGSFDSDASAPAWNVPSPMFDPRR